MGTAYIYFIGVFTLKVYITVLQYTQQLQGLNYLPFKYR